jgi:TPP-dependent 2-oxoacid decarboxylase
MKIGEYLIQAVKDAGAGHVFGIQGDYVLKFYEMLYNSPIRLINTTDEASAGFAADAYARVKGFGAVCVTYGVGGLNLANSIAQAYAELSPVLVISGAPGVTERRNDASLHHKVHDFDFQLKIFSQITVAQAVLDNPETAADEISRVINSVMKHKRPGYIELPRDMVISEAAAPHDKSRDEDTTDREALEEGLSEAFDMLMKARNPMIAVGIEVHRFGLQNEVLALLEKTGLPFFTGVLGKSVLSEKHPQFIGVYSGVMSSDTVRDFVQNADCLLLLGPMITDFSTGMFTSEIDASHCITLNEGLLGISHHVYRNIGMKEFIEHLTTSWEKPKQEINIPQRGVVQEFVPESGSKITVKRLFECIDGFIGDDDIVVAEAGDAMFGSFDLCIHGSTEYISPAFYASLGFAVPASIGVQFAAPRRRAIVLTGDGGFQFNAMMLSIAAKHQLNPIVIILNNNGYGLFRPMVDGEFNDIPDWNYSEIPKVIGSGKGFKVTMENELTSALDEARKNTSSPTIIDVRIDRYDISDTTKRLLERLRKRI